MANQDDVIIIRTVESMTTSILDYFFNIALVTEITENNTEDETKNDLLDGQTFSVSNMEEYSSLPALAEKFKSTSMIYKIGRDVFAQKTNNGVNQSNLRRLVVLRKYENETVEDCLNKLAYKNSYFILVNAKKDSDITSANTWVSQYRKLLFAQTDSEDVTTDVSNDIATTLKESNAGRTALYYHEVHNRKLPDPDNPNEEVDTPYYESLAGALASILSSYPIGGKTASFKRPSDITVDKLSDTEEGHLNRKNVNYFVPYIGGAGDYSTRYLTSDNGVTSSGDEIQKVIGVDRTVLSLQAGMMDVLEQDVPYDDNGGTIVYDKINSVFAQLKRDRVFAEDSIDEETGEIIKSYTIKVLTRANTKKYYPEYFAKKMFIIETEVQFAGSAKRVLLTLAY